jgi:YqaJ-like viral recombinase domain
MNCEIMNDRTDHNRLAEQLSQRLLAQCETAEPVTVQKPRSTRKPRAEAPIAATVATAPAETITSPPAMAKITVSDLQIFDCEQNSPEWRLARLGIPTASSFSDILAKGEGKTRRTYMLKIAGEIITGEPMENIVTAAMERGHIMEAEARDLYALETGANLVRAGFFRNGRAGCSPDSLIGEDGGLEVKTMFPHLLIDVILKDELPTVHKAQVQGTLWITGREWWDLTVYWPGMPRFVKRAYRDEAYIQNLASEVDRFNTELDGIVAQMRQRIGDTLPDFATAA